MSEYRLLAFKVSDLEVEDEIACYEVPSAIIARVRGLLNDGLAPNFVKSSEEGRTMICSLADVKEVVSSSSTFGESGIVYRGREKSHNHLDKILRSAVRITLRSQGWVPSSSGKMYNPSETLASLASGLVDVYRAAVINADAVDRGHTVFIDPVRKLEFNKTYSELENQYQEKVEEISWVKLRGSTTSFYIVNEALNELKNKKDILIDTAQKAGRYIIENKVFNNQLKKELLNSLSSIEIDDILVLTPKSTKLSNELAKKNLNLRSTALGGYILTALPKSILIPVASMDNISIFGGLNQPLWIAPNTKVSEAQNIVKIVNSSSSKLIGVKSLTLDEEPALIKSIETVDRLYLVARSRNEEVKNFDEFLNNRKSHSIVCNDKEFYIVPIVYKLNKLKEINDAKKFSYGLVGKLEKALNSFKGFVKIVAIGNRIPSANNVDEVLKRLNAVKELVFSSTDAGDSKEVVFIAMVFGYFESEKERAELIYRIINDGDSAPILIDVKESIDYAKKRVRGAGGVVNEALSNIEYKIRTSIEHKLTSFGCTRYDIAYPEPFKDYSVVGIDATIVQTSRSQLSIGVAVVIVKQSSRPIHHYSSLEFGQSDDEAIANTILQEVVLKGSRSIVIVNKENIGRIARILIEAGGRDALENMILVGMTKTHSYSRILKADGKEFYNAEFGKYIRLGELEEQELKILRGLAITTQNLVKGVESGTKKTTFISIAKHKNTDIDFNTIINFLLSLNIYGNTSPTWLLSLPWPLHRAHEICENMYRISKHLKTLLGKGYEKL